MGRHYAPHGDQHSWSWAHNARATLARAFSTNATSDPALRAALTRAAGPPSRPVLSALYRWLSLRAPLHDTESAALRMILPGASDSLRQQQHHHQQQQQQQHTHASETTAAATTSAGDAHGSDSDDDENGWGLLVRIMFWAVFLFAACVKWLLALAGRRRLRRRKHALQRCLHDAQSYAEWSAAAHALDVAEGRAAWKADNVRNSDELHRTAAAVCDLEMIRAKLAELAQLFSANDLRALAFALRASLLRNFGGMCHPVLSANSRVGTKRVLEDYVHVVSFLLAYIAQSENATFRKSALADTPPITASAAVAQWRESAEERPEVLAGDTFQTIAGTPIQLPVQLPSDVSEHFSATLLSVENKLTLFNEARHAYGRTALMLSGGASMGINHLGVIKALLDQDLMPKVVCGTSAGALVGSMVGIFEDYELLDIIQSEQLINPLTQRPFSFRYFDEHSSLAHRFRRFLRTGVIQDVRMLQDCLRRNLGDITFEEAYVRTRRILNITVCPVRSASDPPLLLNYLTAPHVLVWSAASASCALPFVFAPVELVAKAANGRLVPYHPDGVRWIDGSISSDIPLARIGELFNVNHFIVSQTNPHVIPRGMPILNTRLAMLLKSELQFRYWQALQLNLVPRFIAAIFPHFMQPYEGDVTIMPEVNVSDLFRLLRNPTVATVKESIAKGERQTYPFLDRIRRQSIIEKTLDLCAEHVARQSRRAHEASARSLRRSHSIFGRVPSWLWLDASSILTSGPVSAVKNRFRGTRQTETAPVEGSVESTSDVEEDAQKTTSTGERADSAGAGASALAWASRLYSRQPVAPRASPPASPARGSPRAPRATQPEFDKVLQDISLAQSAGDGGSNDTSALGTKIVDSEGSCTDEERVLC